ncbi:MAG: dienelactone hydrolase family protein [Planctomycetales bacterium]|nr:dienelactone hydrolase family protein [Planctomycetales bacterium]MCA9166772.1 dienelactone hydrolase family protein [Planctomycetales bacterium]
MRHAIAVLSLLSLAMISADARAEVQTKTITYQHDGHEYRGFLAWDDASDAKRPGVLVVHEWWGLNEYARQRTKQLAELGYVAFAADMYGGGKTVDHPQEAGKMASIVRENVNDWRARAIEALDILKAQPQWDGNHLAAVGYCFGGSTALQLAYTGADLDAVVTFHAALPVATADEAKQIKAKLQINHGADDSFVPMTAVAAFRKPLDEAQVDYAFIAYPGARHSFTVKTADAIGIDGLKYNAAADEKSWAAMKTLLADELK